MELKIMTSEFNSLQSGLGRYSSAVTSQYLLLCNLIGLAGFLISGEAFILSLILIAISAGFFVCAEKVNIIYIWPCYTTLRPVLARGSLEENITKISFLSKAVSPLLGGTAFFISRSEV